MPAPDLNPRFGEVSALGPHGFDLNRVTRRLGRGDNRLGGEVEGNAQHVGVFDVEEAFVIKIVGLAA